MKIGFVIGGLACLLSLVLGASLYGCPRYRVYSRNLSGQAELAEKEWSKKVLIEEAKAKRDSAKMLAEAEVERARGVAEANRIIGESLKSNEAYLRYLWIQGLQDGTSETIYVPTEANLPILESTRKLRNQKTKITFE